MKISIRQSSILVLFGFITYALAAAEEVNEGDESEQELGKRLYDFGLGKRAAYRYVSEYKRLPKYDFGLGKRARQYSFGLGKRSGWNEGYDYDHYQDEEEESVPEIEVYDDNDMQDIGKRAKMYGFGLGKRPLYEFGLGKRAKQYSFGLGKRAKQYSFGLGKKSDRMYSFGLGKRSQDAYNNVDKREVNPNELKAVLQDSHEHTTENATTIMDSHEVMGHGDNVRIMEKRSPRQYSFGLGKRDEYQEESEDEFPRQYRKPQYSFGLGKRRQYSFGLGKRDY